MVGKGSESGVARRSFLSRFGAGLTVFAATLVARESTAGAQAPGNTAWQPARHPQDDWLDQVPGKHRLVFDTTTAAGFGTALRYASNFFYANQSGYGLGSGDIAVVIIARHNSTQFAVSDKLWAKYGGSLAHEEGLLDPRTKRAPAINLFNAENGGAALTNNGVTLDSLIKRGAHFAVCQMASRRLASTIAADTKGDVESVYHEIAANLMPSSHMVPAGIVALSRAQERGYTVAIAG